VNRELALKLMEGANTVIEAETQGRKVKVNKVASSSLLKDSRFKDLFENPDFEINKTADEYRLLNPAVSRLDQDRKKRLDKAVKNQLENAGDASTLRNPLLDDDFSDSERKGSKRKLDEVSLRISLSFKIGRYNLKNYINCNYNYNIYNFYTDCLICF